MHSVDCDVLIAGSGIVGATLACALLQGGMRVALVEATPAIATNALLSTDLKALDLRNFALTRASERIFTRLGIWEKVVAQRVSPFRQMVVWDAQGAGNIHFDSATITEPTLGYIVEQSILQIALATRLAQFPDQLIWHRPARVQRFQLVAAGKVMEVHLQDGYYLTTRLLVGAEGAHSTTRTLAGISYSLHDYGQQAIVANVYTEKPHQETAWQRFLPTGPLAFLPLTDPHLSSIVWSCDTTIANTLFAMEKSRFQSALAEAFAFKLGAITECSQRAIFSLQRRHVHQYVQPRLALVGDAAHTIHPLAGQGVNLGLLDIATLSEVVLEAFQQGQDFGNYSMLRRYERWRKGNNLIMGLMMDGFKNLFSSSSQPLKWLRNLGLSMTNELLPVKHLMRHAMGLEGDLPRLARVEDTDYISC
jgi:2-octaprenylphenol hydroxylase